MDHQPSDKVAGAEDQQERLRFEGWVNGFVDGEGCFTVSIIRNRSVTTREGWQVFPEFVVSQGDKSRKALEAVKEFFDCGHINLNTRRDNHHEQMLKYVVRSIRDINEKIIPFFERNELKTYKRNDFQIFCRIICIMIQRKHLSEKGLGRIRSLMQQMNRRKYLKS